VLAEKKKTLRRGEGQQAGEGGGNRPFLGTPLTGTAKGKVQKSQRKNWDPKTCTGGGKNPKPKNCKHTTWQRPQKKFCNPTEGTKRTWPKVTINPQTGGGKDKGKKRETEGGRG